MNTILKYFLINNTIHHVHHDLRNLKNIINFKLKSVFFIFLIIFNCLNLISIEKLPDIMDGRWMVIGPFENYEKNGSCSGFNNDFLTGIGGETGLNPEIKQTINGLRWQHIDIDSGNLNFIKAFGQINYSVAYAYKELILKTDQKAILKIGSDDGIKVWLNGILILAHHIHRSLNPDDELIIVNLKAGLNKILVKVGQGTGEWGFTLKLRSIEEEITDFNKKKIKGLKINLSENIINNEIINGYIMTNPSFYINENINLILYNIHNQKINKMNTTVSKKFEFKIKNLEPGLYFLKAYGSGKLSGLISDKEIIIVGNYNKIINNYINLAKAISIINKYPYSPFDIRSTCLFLKNQLEGKMYSSLTTPERNLRAMYTINEIYNYIKNPDYKFTGLNQRAYYSVIDETYQPYSIYIPSSYDKNKKYSLLVCLHGYSDDDYNAAKNVADCKPEDFIIVGAFGRGDIGYFSIGEQDILDVIDIMKKNYNIDNDKIYITGWSMGGFGTWRFGQIYSDQFAAIATFCGWTWDHYLDNLINLPVLIIHGTEDNVVPINMNINAEDRLKNFDYNVRFDIVKGADHDVWRAWIKDSSPDKLLNYFRKFKRTPYPKNINIHTKYIRYGKQYWAKILEFLDPNKAGLLKIKIIDERHVNILTGNLKLFEINLDHPDLAKKGRIILNVDGSSILFDAGKSNAVIEFSIKKNRFESTDDYKKPDVPHNGGGITDLFMNKLYIVYGTKKKSSIKKWKEFAETLSDFQVNKKISYGTKIGQYKIISDKEVLKLIESQDIKIKNANLLLLGSYNENYIIEKINSDLPVKFNGKNIEILKEKYKNPGLIFTFPSPLNKKNLIGIMIFPFNDDHVLNYARNLNLNLRMFNSAMDITGYTFPDIIVFKSYNKIAALGYFNYNWQELNITKIK